MIRRLLRMILAFGQLLVARMRKPSAAANTESEAARARVLLRLAADRQIEEAESLRSQGTKESLLLAVESYETALLVWRTIGMRQAESTTLNNIGAIYYSLGENQEALDFFNQALALHRAVGDRNGEARAFNNIGMVYESLGDYQKALDFYNQALTLARAVGNRAGEADVLKALGLV